MTRPTNRLGPSSDDAFTDVELADLIPTFIAIRSDLDIAEQANIAAAHRWAFGRRRVATVEQFLMIGFCDRVHRRMFGDVWKSAGEHRTRSASDGVLPARIAPRLDSLFEDVQLRHQGQLGTPSERAIRLHHELLEIDVYQVGNARHARLMADLYLHLVGMPRLPWGDPDALESAGATRRADVSALQSALDKTTKAASTEGRRGRRSSDRSHAAKMPHES